MGTLGYDDGEIRFALDWATEAAAVQREHQQLRPSLAPSLAASAVALSHRLYPEQDVSYAAAVPAVRDPPTPSSTTPAPAGLDSNSMRPSVPHRPASFPILPPPPLLPSFSSRHDDGRLRTAAWAASMSSSLALAPLQLRPGQSTFNWSDAPLTQSLPRPNLFNNLAKHPEAHHPLQHGPSHPDRIEGHHLSHHMPVPFRPEEPTRSADQHRPPLRQHYGSHQGFGQPRSSYHPPPASASIFPPLASVGASAHRAGMAFAPAARYPDPRDEGRSSPRRPARLEHPAGVPTIAPVAPHQPPTQPPDINPRLAKQSKKSPVDAAPGSSDGSTVTLTAAEAKAKRRRTLIACERCRQHKLRCLGGPKPCTACAKRGVGDSCEFVSEVRRRGKARKSRPVEEGVIDAADVPLEGSDDVRPLKDQPSPDAPRGPNKLDRQEAPGVDLPFPPSTNSGRSDGTSRRSSASLSTPQPTSAGQTGATTATDGSWSSETRASLSSVGLRASLCAGGEWQERELSSGLLERLQEGVSTEEMAPP